MSRLIAVHPCRGHPNDASSPVWTQLLQAAGHRVREVDVHRADILEQLDGCHGFMWRHGHYPSMRLIARRLLPVIERELGLVVYPDQDTCWHYDDKIIQSYLFDALGIPAPRTWVFYDKSLADEFAESASYPLIIKLYSGAGSSNVMLLQSVREARAWIARLFGSGVRKLAGPKGKWLDRAKRKAAVSLGLRAEPQWEVHKDYVLFQEFLPGNRFDTRVTVIGDRAFGFRRFNRADDFRASGSGRIDYDPDQIAPDFIRLAFDTARKLRAQSCAIDGLRRDDEPVVGEVSYTYVSWLVHACPGHWDSNMQWHVGQMRPEEAQIQDFMARLEERWNA